MTTTVEMDARRSRLGPQPAIYLPSWTADALSRVCGAVRGSNAFGGSSAIWERVPKFHPQAAALADRHYNRRKIGSPQFMPPGQTIVLLRPDAVFGWWRPDPRSGIRAMNGRDGWTCTIFRNESPDVSSILILAAEVFLDGQTCGPDGMMTYVDVRKVKSRNPGYCFKQAGWRIIGRSADRHKLLLQKPFEQRGVCQAAQGPSGGGGGR